MKSILILISFFALVCQDANAQGAGSFVDSRDGQRYGGVQIYDQVWMAENLNYKIKGSGMYSEEYGSLYNWEMAQYVCPSGWHLPSDGEWKQLEYNLGMDYSELNNEASYERESGKVGYQLKAKQGWNYQAYSNKGNGADVWGFKTLPGGFYQTYNQKFMWWGWSALFWTSTPYNQKNAMYRQIDSSNDGVNRGDMYKVHGLNVRCIKN